MMMSNTPASGSPPDEAMLDRIFCAIGLTVLSAVGAGLLFSF